MIDIYALYRRVPPAARRPFNRFFDSASFTKAYEHLRHVRGFDEATVIKRSRGSVAAPATAYVHPLIAMEFVRWVDYGLFVDLTDLSPFTGQSALTTLFAEVDYEPQSTD